MVRESLENPCCQHTMEVMMMMIYIYIYIYMCVCVCVCVCVKELKLLSHLSKNIYNNYFYVFL